MQEMSTAARGRRVVLAGDSTVAPYVATAYPMCGWGAHLGAALTSCCCWTDDRPPAPVHVVELAKNGASTESHRLEGRSEEHTTELQSRGHIVCGLLLEKKNNGNNHEVSISNVVTTTTKCEI